MTVEPLLSPTDVYKRFTTLLALIRERKLEGFEGD